MPIFRFHCDSCNMTERRLVYSSTEEVRCGCGTLMKKNISSCPDVKITEKRDGHKNKNVVSNIEEITKRRSKEYFVDNCIDEAIHKASTMVGEKEAYNMARRLGWVDKKTGKKISKIDLK